MGSDHKTWIKVLEERMKTVQENKELWCSHCAKFTPFKDLIFHGKTEKGESLASSNYENIFEFEGFIYTCMKCGCINEGMEIDKIEV